MKKKLFLYAILLLAAMPTFASDEICAEMRSICFDKECDDLCNSLALKDLCAKKIKAKQGLFKEICAHQIKSESICTKKLGVEDVSIANVCANNINTTTLCVTGTARINEVCGLYRASAAFFADTPYVLGAPINFDKIIDDPNGNISLAPFSYTVPVTGYYVASVQVDSKDLTGANIILGTPIGHLELIVNGVERRRSFSPFLTFNDTQETDLTFLLLLNAGDVITIDYKVLIVDQTTGTTFYVGNNTLIGGDSQTIFKIHYLSSTCTPAGNCPSCSLIPVPCSTECIPLPNSCVHRPE